MITESGGVIHRGYSECDPIAVAHARGLSDGARQKLTDGVDRELLRKRLIEAQLN